MQAVVILLLNISHKKAFINQNFVDYVLTSVKGLTLNDGNVGPTSEVRKVAVFCYCAKEITELCFRNNRSVFPNACQGWYKQA
jgi:hypothetical protein